MFPVTGHSTSLSLTCFYFYLKTDLYLDFRFEWQSRGSPHPHGLLWINPETSRPPSDLSSAASRQALATYRGAHIEAINPFSCHIEHLPINTEVLRKPFSVESQTFLTLAQVVDKFQTHECNSQYCLRRNHQT